MTRVLDAGLKTQLIISKDNLLRNLSVAIYYYSNYCLSLDWNWSLIQFPKRILSIRSFYPRDVKKLNSSCDVNLCQWSILAIGHFVSGISVSSCRASVMSYQVVSCINTFHLVSDRHDPRHFLLSLPTLFRNFPREHFIIRHSYCSALLIQIERSHYWLHEYFSLIEMSSINGVDDRKSKSGW